MAGKQKANTHCTTDAHNSCDLKLSPPIVAINTPISDAIIRKIKNDPNNTAKRNPGEFRIIFKYGFADFK